MRSVGAVENEPTRAGWEVKRATIGVAQAMLAVALRPQWKAHGVVSKNWHARGRLAGAVPRLRGSVGWLAIVVVRAGSKGTRHGAREHGSQ
jgi:hypothetical protein